MLPLRIWNGAKLTKVLKRNNTVFSFKNSEKMSALHVTEISSLFQFLCKSENVFMIIVSSHLLLSGSKRTVESCLRVTKL